MTAWAATRIRLKLQIDVGRNRAFLREQTATEVVLEQYVQVIMPSSFGCPSIFIRASTFRASSKI
jgi:hypothetical protein